ncbi:MAG: zinc-binding alcohol dehydrogenase family protein [Pseudomonadota bacterium]|nr:zinc-binding alcohol dehydrogenase family protein [Pseudomonadota bacterium]
MKAVGVLESKPISAAGSLLDVEMPDPLLRPDDLLVEIEAISVNPADAKRRMGIAPDQVPQEPIVLGYDAVGIVRDVGPNVVGFSKGDRVWYAGDVSRAGSYAERQAVDHRIASLAPAQVSPVAAASLPLVSLTAWEMLFDRLQVPVTGYSDTLLVIGGAGGVGSVTQQLARKLTGLHVIATASRPETVEWCLKMGAHETVDHKNLVKTVQALGHSTVRFIVQYADTAQHWDAMCELVEPQGRIGTIVETQENLDISALQAKSAALMWELMFTRSLFGTPDMARQGQILSRVARLVDDGVVRTTEQKVLKGLSADTLKEAHRIIETGQMIGKLVIEY